jgi:hypothetical protein
VTARPARHNGAVSRRPGRLLIAAAVTVAVLGVAAGGAAVWWRWDTGRQPQVGDVVADMNRAVADAVVAAGPDAAVAVSPVVRSATCRLGAFREGGVFTAQADLYTDPGGEDAVVTRIAQGLAGRYPVTRGPAVAGVRPLAAGTAGGVTVAVRRLSPGWLTVRARSACSLGAVAEPGAPAAPADGVADVTALLRLLGTEPARLTEHRVSCAAGAIVTVAATSATTGAGDLGDRLATTVPPTARVFDPGRANRLVHRTGAVSVVVAATDDGTAVTVQHTTAC